MMLYNTAYARCILNVSISFSLLFHHLHRIERARAFFKQQQQLFFLSLSLSQQIQFQARYPVAVIFIPRLALPYIYHFHCTHCKIYTSCLAKWLIRLNRHVVFLKQQRERQSHAQIHLSLLLLFFSSSSLFRFLLLPPS